MIKERVTVDFDSESYYLDGEYWESWDSYGEEMAEEINKLLDKQDKRIKELEQFKLSIISFAECNENINERTLNDLIELIDYDRE